MSLKKDIIGADVQIGTNQAQAELAKLTKETAQYRGENDRLLLLMKKMEVAGKKNTDEWKNLKKQFDANKIAIKDTQLKTEEYTKKLGLTSLTIKQLRTRMSDLKRQLASTVPNTPEWDQYNRQLAETQTRYNQLNGATKQTSGFLNLLKGAAGGLLPAFSIGAIVAGLGRLGKSIFDTTKQIQGETIRSVTVFGDQLGYVEKQAEKVAEKMGVTNREFVSMAANTADLLIPLDFTRKKAAEMATQVQSLSGALDEWTAGKYGVAEVSNILTKAMLGEMEQLKGLGIAIRQDSKEYTDLVKQKEQMEGVTNAQARAMATLDLLFKKSADAQNAYLQDGNKLLRFQKSLSLFFKQIKEDISSGFNNSMKTATERFKEQRDKVYDLEKNFIPLIDRYDELSKSKIPLTSTEQKELNGLIQQIATIAPSAVTEIDAYGKALGISADAARQLVEEQKKYLLVKNADEIADQEKNLEKLNKQLEKEVINKQWLVASSKTDDKLREIGWYDKEIQKVDGKLESIIALKEGTEAYLKVLKGEPLITPPPPDTTAEKSLIKVQEDLLEIAKKWPETTEAEIIAKNRKIESIETEIKRLNELGTVTAKERAEAEKRRKEDELNSKKQTVTAAKVDNNLNVNDYKENLDILKSMESDFMDFKKEIDKEGQELSEKNIARIIAEKEARQELTDIQINAFGQIASAMAGAFKQGSAAQLAMMAIEKGIAIAQIWINLAREKSAINLAAANIAAMPIPGAMFAAASYSAAMTAKAIVAAKINTGLIAAQTIASAVSSKSRNKKEAYYDGGFTGDGSDTDISGFVHANEFVANASAVRNPSVKQILDIIDLAQKSGTVSTLNLPAIIASGRRDGGYTSSKPSSESVINYNTVPDPSQNKLLSELTSTLNKFMEWQPEVSVEAFERKKKKYDKIITNTDM